MKKIVIFLCIVGLILGLMICLNKKSEKFVITNDNQENVVDKEIDKSLSQFVKMGNSVLIQSYFTDLSNNSNIDFIKIGYVKQDEMGLQFENFDTLNLTSKQHIGVLRIETLNNLNSVLNNMNKKCNIETRHGSEVSLKERLSKYNDDYFKNNILVLFSIQEGSGSISHELENIKFNDDNIQFIIQVNIFRESGTDDMANWIGIFEMKKDIIPNGIKFDAKADYKLE